MTLLVLRVRTANRDLASEARDGLLSVGANIVGTVLNGVSRRDRRYGRYSSYGGYYGRRYGQPPQHNG